MNKSYLGMGMIILIYSFLIIFFPDDFNIGGIIAFSLMMIAVGIFDNNVNSIGSEKK